MKRVIRNLSTLVCRSLSILRAAILPFFVLCAVANGDRSPVTVLVILGIFCLFSYFTCADCTQFLMAVRSMRWKKASAMISEVKRDTSVDSCVANFPGSGKYKPFYTVTICVYRFQVNDVWYSGDRYSFGGYADQNTMLRNSGDTIAVFYDPQNPSESVVVKGLTPTLLFSPLVALSTMTALLWMLAEFIMGSASWDHP